MTRQAPGRGEAVTDGLEERVADGLGDADLVAVALGLGPLPGRSWTTTIEYAGTLCTVALPLVAEPIDEAAIARVLPMPLPATNWVRGQG